MKRRTAILSRRRFSIRGSGPISLDQDTATAGPVAADDGELTAADLAREFLPRLKDELNRIRRTESYQRNTEALLHWAIRQISPKLDEGGIRLALKAGGKDDKGVDAAWWDANSREGEGRTGAFFIAQSKCPDSLVDLQTYSLRVANEVFSGFSWLTSPGAKLKPALERVREQFDLHFTGGERVRLAVIVGGLATNSLWDQAEVLEEKLNHLYPNGRISVEIFDIPKLDSMYRDRLEQGDLPPVGEARFRIRTEYHQRTYGPKKALIGQIPLKEIWKLVEDHHLSLFAKNLRVPISHSNYNEGFVESLRSNADRKNVWYYNNGITAVCDNYRFDESEDTEEKFSTIVTNGLTIVNGCQTCATVHGVVGKWMEDNTTVAELEDIDLLIRLISTAENGSGETDGFGSLVARYTNSQNPIHPRDLRANDPEQVRLREELRSRGYFFEIKDGEWDLRLEEDPNYRLNFPRKRPLIDNERAAQYYLSFWLGNPVQAKMNKSSIFEDNEVYQSVFGFGNKSEAVLLPWLAATWMDVWRKSRGYGKRAPTGRRRNKLSRPMVYTHGNLILLAMVGWGLERNAGTQVRSDAVRLGRADDVLTQVLEGSNVGAINADAARRTFDKSLDRLMDVLFSFVKTEMDKDHELSVRNLLVGKRVWQAILKSHKNRIITATKQLKPMLVG